MLSSRTLALLGFVFLLAFVVCSAQSPLSGSGCLDGWVRNGSYCYLFSRCKGDYYYSQKTCHWMRSEMVSITSEKEQTFISEKVRKYGPEYEWYIGLHDTTRWNPEKTYIWEDHSEVDYTNWAKGMPGTNKLRRCTYFAPAYHGDKWIATPCGRPCNYICKTPAED